MNKGLFFSLCVLASIAWTSGRAEEDRLATLKALKIDAGTITSVTRDDTPVLTAPDGKILRNNIPPHTIIKALLHPATGSNIRVEIWLPDAGKWNGRFLGLGNGGAAGNINPNGLAGGVVGGFAVATTDMGTAPAPNSGIGNRGSLEGFWLPLHASDDGGCETIRQHFLR